MGREKWGRRREGSSRPDHFLARRISYACAPRLPYGQEVSTIKAPGEVPFTAHNQNHLELVIKSDVRKFKILNPTGTEQASEVTLSRPDFIHVPSVKLQQSQSSTGRKYNLFLQSIACLCVIKLCVFVCSTHLQSSSLETLHQPQHSELHKRPRSL